MRGARSGLKVDEANQSFRNYNNLIQTGALRATPHPAQVRHLLPQGEKGRARYQNPTGKYFRYRSV